MTDSKIHTIIHSAATAAAAAASGMAQVPGSDNAIITPIQIAMIIAIGRVHDQEMDKTMAMSILTSVSASIVGRTISQIVVGWVPSFGNVINAATAASVTEAVGWAANEVLEPE